MTNFLNECYWVIGDSEKNIIITIGLIGTIVFAYIGFNYDRLVISKNILPYEFAMFILYLIAAGAASSIVITIITILFL